MAATRASLMPASASSSGPADSTSLTGILSRIISIRANAKIRRAGVPHRANWLVGEALGTAKRGRKRRAGPAGIGPSVLPQDQMRPLSPAPCRRPKRGMILARFMGGLSQVRRRSMMRRAVGLSYATAASPPRVSVRAVRIADQHRPGRSNRGSSWARNQRCYLP